MNLTRLRLKITIFANNFRNIVTRSKNVHLLQKMCQIFPEKYAAFGIKVVGISVGGKWRTNKNGVHREGNESQFGN